MREDMEMYINGVGLCKQPPWSYIALIYIYVYIYKAFPKLIIFSCLPFFLLKEKMHVS